MSKILTVPPARYRAKLLRPTPAQTSTQNANSSQVRRLIEMAMAPSRPTAWTWSRVYGYSLFAMTILLVLLASVMALRRPLSTPTTGKTKPTLTATFIIGQAEPRTIRHEFTGNVVPSKRSELGFIQPGRVQRLLVKKGDRVQAGTVLAELDTSTVRAELDVAQTEFRLAESRLGTLEDTQSPFTVKRTRYSADTSSHNDAYVQAKAILDHWRAVIRQLELRLSQCRIVAPYNALVTHTYLSEGSLVAVDRPLLCIVSTDQLAIRLTVGLRDAERFKWNLPYTLSYGTRSFQGTLTAIVPEVDALEQSRELHFEIEDPSGIEWSGDETGLAKRFELHVPTDETGFRVPRTSVRTQPDGSQFVYVISNEAKDTESETKRTTCARQRSVEVLGTIDGWLLIRGAIRPGDRIVSVLRKETKDGDEIRYSDVAQWRQEALLGQ